MKQFNTYICQGVWVKTPNNQSIDKRLYHGGQHPGLRTHIGPDDDKNGSFAPPMVADDAAVVPSFLTVLSP